MPYLLEEMQLSYQLKVVDNALILIQLKELKMVCGPVSGVAMTQLENCTPTQVETSSNLAQGVNSNLAQRNKLRHSSGDELQPRLRNRRY